MERRGPNVSTVIAAWAMAIWQGLARTARAVILIEEVRPYRPEAYYMRGPGPIKRRLAVVRTRPQACGAGDLE